MKAKALVIGSGGREHALGWNLGLSDELSEVLFAPGNAGTQEGKGRNVPIDCTKKANFQAVYDLIVNEGVDLTVVGPEASLAEGLVDYLNARGCSRVFGPTQAAAQLEADKFFSYDIMEKLGIPQASSVKCYTLDDAVNAIEEMATERGVVAKARGLTGGKGVTIYDSKKQALEGIMLHAQQHGTELLIAERLFGQEVSVFGIADGEMVLPLKVAVQDHKRQLDGDKGPNTGGMGAYCPTSIAPLAVILNIAENMMTPVIRQMKAEGREYKGFIYAGMIMTAEGPKVLEFNVRFGDPECQPAMMMTKNSLYEPLSLALEGRLDEIKVEFKSGAACCVVLSSQGYPGQYDVGLPISRMGEAGKMGGIKIFHSGTKTKDGKIVTAGGRVLSVVGYSLGGLAYAQRIAYKAAELVSVPGGFHYRKDIADKEISRQQP